MTDDRIREITSDFLCHALAKEGLPPEAPCDTCIAIIRAACDEAAREERERCAAAIKTLRLIRELAFNAGADRLNLIKVLADDAITKAEKA